MIFAYPLHKKLYGHLSGLDITYFSNANYLAQLHKTLYHRQVHLQYLAENLNEKVLVNGDKTMQNVEKWPLMHGSYILYKVWKDIKENGILSGEKRKPLTSGDYDRASGRTSYVYLSLMRKNTYGLGQMVLVDPKVIHSSQARASLFDVASRLYSFFGRQEWLDDIPSFFPEWVLEPTELISCIIKCKKHITKTNGHLWSEIPVHFRGALIQKHIFELQSFHEYMDQYYLSIPDFYEEFKKTLSTKTEKEFLNRVGDEEIRIHGKVPPEYLIGYCSGGDWNEWNKPSDPLTQEKVKIILDFLRLPKRPCI